MKLIVFILCAFLILDVYAEKEASIANILENHATCVDHHTAHRLYLRPDHIVPTQEGLLLKLKDDTYCTLSVVRSDALGSYVRVPPALQKKCESCGAKYSIVCQSKRCKNPKTDSFHKPLPRKAK